MLNEEVVLLDSDDDAAVEEAGAGGEGGEGGGGDDVQMEYNSGDYADLVGPNAVALVSTGSGTPSPVGSSTPPVASPGVGGVSQQKIRVPKRPGAMPPFALFSQEMRAKLQGDDPEMSFGDLGRRLGEMWHSLTEDEKEDYRKRAREVADAKMKSWKETMQSIPKHQQLEYEQKQKRVNMKIKKKKTSGYAIFCSEYRRKYAAENPNMQFSDISRKVAEDWRLVTDETRREYEEKAQRFNVEEEKKWRQKVYAHQQQQMRIAQNRQNMVKQKQQQQRQYQGYSQQQNQQQYYNKQNYGQQNNFKQQQQQQQQRGQYNQHSQQQTSQRQNNQGFSNQEQNNSGLVISSVSSLSQKGSTSQADVGGAINLPSGITISRAEPEINLPSSITISRVEPEIQIVEENIVAPVARPVQMQPQKKVMMGRGGMMPMRGMMRGRTMMGMRGGMRGRGPGRPPISPQRMMGPRGMMAGRFRNPGAPSRGRPSMMQNGMGMRAGSPMMSRGVPMRPRGMVPSRGGSFRGTSPSFQGSSPLKRIAPMPGMPRMPSLSTRPHGPLGPGGPPAKRMRIPGPYNMGMGGGMGPGQGNYNTAVESSSEIEVISSSSATPPMKRAVNPATLDAVGRLCRICASPNAVIFRLKDKLELVERVQNVLGLSIDLEEDEKRSYPGVVCRKCCNLVETFFHYKKSVAEGQTNLETQVEEHIKNKEEERLAAEAAASVEAVLNSPPSPGCIGVDPLDSILPDNGDDNIQIMDDTHSNDSVLPDLPEEREATPHIQVGAIRIKQELGGKLGRKMMTSMSSTAFADVDVKVEPVEKEKDTSKEEEAEKAPGELFSQLLGEVNKLNDKEGEKKETSEEKDSENKSEKDGNKLSKLPPGISISSTTSLKVPPGISVSRSGGETQSGKESKDDKSEDKNDSEGKNNSDDKNDSDDKNISEDKNKSSENTQSNAYNHNDYSDLVGPWNEDGTDAPLGGLMDPWIPDDNGQEDLENAPGLEVRIKDVRGANDEETNNDMEGGNDENMEYYDDTGDNEPEKTAPEVSKPGNDPLVEAAKNGSSNPESKEAKSQENVGKNDTCEKEATEHEEPNNDEENQENLENTGEMRNDEIVDNDEPHNDILENDGIDDHDLEDKDGDLDDDFGGYDPLQLVQITTESGDVNDLDFEMEEDMLTDSIDEADYDQDQMNMEDDGEEDSNMNLTDNELSMETPDPDGMKENEDMNNDTSDGMKENEDLNNDTSDQVKDNVEVPVVFEDGHEMSENSLNAHDSADNDGDAEEVSDKKLNKNNDVSENAEVSEQKESEEEQSIYNDAPEISSNYDEACYADPQNNDDHHHQNNDDDNDPQNNDDNDLDEQGDFEDVEDIGPDEHFSDNNVDQSYGDFSESVQNNYPSQPESAEEHDDSIEEASSHTTSHPEPDSVCDEES